MPPIAVPNRPFASERITGLALPDGIFETTLGQQRINVHVKNQGAAPAPNVNFYVESVSDPGIVVTPRTYTQNLGPAAPQLLWWDADFSAATPGAQRISFIADDGAQRTRIIKKIFVTRVTFNPATMTFGAITPEGRMNVRLHSMIGPKGACCCTSRHPRRPGKAAQRDGSFLEHLRRFGGHDPAFKFCSRHYLLKDLEVEVVPTPPFAGQYSDLPFQDPWWKVLLCIIAVLLLIGAAIAEAVDGSGDVTVTGGGGGEGDPDSDCCGVGAEGGGSSYLAAGLVAAAAGTAAIAAASDVRDPFRRGQDHTLPAAGEITVGERLRLAISYPEPVALGSPFAVKADWKYTRVTTGASYAYGVSEVNNNVHVLTHYDVDAPDVVRLYKREPFIVRARFRGAKDDALHGEQLFVQCFLAGPAGQFRSFVLQDGGLAPDEKANDGVYTGVYQFALEDSNPRGMWTYFVIAQDVNNAQQNLTPEQAAQIIGGMVLTHQLTIDFGGGTCAFVPDGDVHVI